MKRCSCCKELKSESEFYKDKRTKDGLKCQCKKCHMATSIRTRNEDNKRQINTQYMRRARIQNTAKFRERERTRVRPKDEKCIARELVNAAVRKGELVKPSTCQECGRVRKVTAHHGDYSKPLEVQWLCYGCHGKKHRKAS